MKMLLDTHALLWFLLDSPSLSKNARSHIELMENTILVSPASYWEIAIKISLGKYQLPEPLGAFMDKQLCTNHFLILPISTTHANCVANLPFHHRDPFDRMIVAQALSENIPLVSTDRAMDAYGVMRIW